MIIEAGLFSAFSGRQKESLKHRDDRHLITLKSK